MELINLSTMSKIQVKLHNYFFDKRIRQHSFAHSSIDFAKSKTVGIIFDTNENQKAILSFAERLKNQGKIVYLLGFVDKKIKNGNFPFKFFSKNDLNFFLIPAGKEVEQFTDRELDILINLSLKKVAALDYIAAFSKAKFRVGPVISQTHSYDLMIDTSKNNTMDNFIKALTINLKKMSPVVQ